MRHLSLITLVFMTAMLWATDQAPEIKTDAGVLKGVVSGDIMIFKGVPFAAPPVGDLRWRAPQPVTPWAGVRKATEYSYDCMQAPTSNSPLDLKVSEDCLYLNVWASAARPAKPLPVLVAIYGGAFTNGGTYKYSATDNGIGTAHNGVIFVSFNYRVGRFGFFAHPALTAENHKGPLGNYGNMDQIAALQWVQKNIAAFGGDPNNVTIMGESAGGGSVLTLITSPLAKGLFHKAICLSGGGRGLLMGQRHISKVIGNIASAEQVGVNFAAKVGVTATGPEAIIALRKLSAKQIVAGLNWGTIDPQTYSGPMVDGVLISETPDEAVRAGRWSHVPLIIGATSADIGGGYVQSFDALFAPFGASADKAKAVYNPEHSTNLAEIAASVGRDSVMLEPARFIARAFTAAGVPSFEYRFSYVPESLRDKLKGAPHASEMSFVMGSVKAAFGDKATAQDLKMQDQFNGYFLNFAKTGNPNAEGLPTWPTYEAKNDVLLDLAIGGPKAVADPLKARLDLTETLAK